MTAPDGTAITGGTDRRPRDEEIDVYGSTHPGKARSVNQDHFLICSLQRQIQVHRTSLPDPGQLPLTERLAFLAMVADGVGGGLMGEEASRLALEGVMAYVAHGMHCYYTADSADDATFARALEDAALRCHTEIAQRAGKDASRRGMATTLTLWIGVWPRAYLLHVGDSRAYLLRGGELAQISRDQTMAQDLPIGASSPAPARTRRGGPTCCRARSAAAGPRRSSPASISPGARWACCAVTDSPGTSPTSGSASGSGR